MVDHHYSRSDLAAIVGALDTAGMPYIEVGHGNGVGSQLFRDPKLRATTLPLVDDQGHAEVSLRVAVRAKVGVVLTAGRRFAPVDYVDRIADLGYAFVRLAVMPDEIDDELMRYVRRVKERGMLCSINMMQTYVKTPAQVAELAKRGADAGADWFYVVDSAGGMMVDEVKRYVTAILEAAPVEVGLHAHNNLGCAVANCLAAVEAGATLCDGTLNGMGRATGNPATEQLAVALRDRLAHDIDLDTLVALGGAIRSLFEDAGNDPMDFVSGAALVHSRNVPKVFEAARVRDRSRASFLISVGAEARNRGVLNAMQYTDELYDAAAAAVPPARRVEATDAMVAVTSEQFLARWNGGARVAIEELSLLSQQRHLPSVVHVSRAAAAFATRPVPWQGAVAGVTIPWTEQNAPWDVDGARLPDFVIVDDGDPEPPVRGRQATWRIAFRDLYARAVQDQCQALRNLGATLWCPEGAAADADSLLGTLPRTTGTRPAGKVAILLGADDGIDALLGSGDFGVLVGHGSSSSRARVEAAHRRGARVVIPPWSTAIADAAAAWIRCQRDLSSADATDDLTSQMLDPDDAQTAARRAAASHLDAILSGKRRL